ncbi:MAG TPA: 3-oxoacyl-ACP synthase [Lachnospiraceae bacterium]|nr:beta-ketoacyl-ACP synthase III [uncultured Lachnoclostridium sp.]HAU86698.1 3-oxoacyl-ACP synthase [Lachnospiraceae bacterium]
MKVIGTGSYLPDCIITNEALTGMVDTSDEWIQSRTGIKERRVSCGEENTQFAIKAARRAVENSGLKPDDIGIIIVATATSDYVTPSVACFVQEALNIPKAIAFDINAACAGFVYALNTAYCYLNSGMAENALIIGSETLSKITDYSDRGTCVLFADASGAVVVRRKSKHEFVSELGADGTKNQVIHCKQRPISNCIIKNECRIDYLHMNGREVYKFVVKEIPALITRVIEKSDIKIGDVKYFILHQANKRMNEIIAKNLGLSFDKFPCNLERTGNTSAASVPVLLDEVNRKGMLSRGDYIVICSFGAGMTWGASLLRW